MHTLIRLSVVLAVVVAAAVLSQPAQAAPAAAAADPPQWCAHHPVLQTADGAKKRADRAWDDEALKMRAGPRERVRIQARCAPSRSGRAHVIGHINRAQSEYKKAKRRAERREQKRELYQKLITPPGASKLASMRQCESGGDYQAVNPAGYYGAYQFDSSAWQLTEKRYKKSGWPEKAAPSPTAASPKQQDIRAAILFQMMGASPWPNCA